MKQWCDPYLYNEYSILASFMFLFKKPPVLSPGEEEVLDNDSFDWFDRTKAETDRRNAPFNEIAALGGANASDFSPMFFISVTPFYHPVETKVCVWRWNLAEQNIYHIRTWNISGLHRPPSVTKVCFPQSLPVKYEAIAI